MNNLSISYLVTCSTETTTLNNLLDTLYCHLQEEDELVVVYDTDLVDPNEKGYVTNITNRIPNGATTTIKVVGHALQNNYAEHKNWGIKQCTKTWIMQIDADELPTEVLLSNIKDIIKANPDIETFWIPRINDFKGVTSEHAKIWGWKLSPSTSIVHEKIIDTDSTEYKFLKNNGYILEEIKL